MTKNILILALAISIVGYVASRTWIRHILTDDGGDAFLWTGGISFVILAFILVAEANFSASTQTYINRMALSIILVTAIFGIWGAFSEAGKKRYTEMDGIIPYLAMATAAIILVVLIILNIIWAVKVKGK